MRNHHHWGKHLELFEMFESFRDDPRVQEKLSEAAELQEGTGAPEGRADFSIFLQTVIRHRVRERFSTVAAKWRSYVGIESAQDFREHTVSELGGIVGMAPVNEDGEYPRLRSAEAVGPPFAVGKHGGVYNITFEVVINDETDRILNRTPRELGRMSAEYVSRLVIALVESNPNYIDGQPFISVARGNETLGAGAQPTEDNLATVVSQMRLRRNADGIPLAHAPRRVLTQSTRTALKIRQILRSQFTGVVNQFAGLPTGAPQFYTGTDNPLAYDGGILPPDSVIEEPWLNDPDDWLILADAEDRPAFIAAFLRNRQTPFIGIQDPGVRDAFSNVRDPYTLDFDNIPFKVRHILGAAIGEPMAVHRMRP